MVWLIIDACSFVGKKVQKARPEVKSLDFAGLLTWDLHNFCVETKNTLVVKWWQIHCRCDVDSGEWDMNAVNLALMSVSWCLEVGISISISIYLSIYLYIYIYRYLYKIPDNAHTDRSNGAEETVSDSSKTVLGTCQDETNSLMSSLLRGWNPNGLVYPQTWLGREMPP